ncbi:MAG TPA: alpha/beta family hydrolase [Bryobacteraceae bacterium]|nr:alpha/beta family hydrolase [Bryobacteraceae bacterium]
MIRGVLHQPAASIDAAIAITHGASGNCNAPLLVALADAFADAGMLALRYDLPYRQQRPSGPPSPARDREGIRRAAAALRQLGAQRVFLCGSSYGGRQSSMLAAEDSNVARALLLLSYPLHLPGKPEKPRTDHFPNLETPAMFAHGTRDAFGSIDELRGAIAAIPARHQLEIAEGAPHGLPAKLAPWIVSRFVEFVAR